MIEEGWKSKTVGMKLRFHDFTTLSVQRTLKHWVSSAEELYAVARELLGSRWNGSTPVRLIGIGFSNLVSVEAQDQMELFTDEFTRQKKVEEAVFRIRRKLGETTLTKASLMESERRRRARRAGPPSTDPGGPPDGPASEESVRPAAYQPFKTSCALPRSLACPAFTDAMWVSWDTVHWTKALASSRSETFCSVTVAS